MDQTTIENSYLSLVLTLKLINDDYGPEPSSPSWLLIFDDRGKYVDNVRIEVINDVEVKRNIILGKNKC